MASRSRFALLFAVVLAALLTANACAQDPAPDQAGPENTGPMHTLHVYMDLIQVPVLVLDSEQGRMKPIDPTKFQVSLDSGPVFRPRHVRQEGDDPITLGILLDANGAPDLMPGISAALSSLAPDSLHKQDHVSIFVLNCTLFRTLQDVPADPEKLKLGTDNALASWLADHKLKHPKPCSKQVQLWDAMGFVVNEIGKLPGRRVLLAVTDGSDKGSRNSWNTLREFAQQTGVAIFGYVPSVGSNGRVGMPTYAGGRGRGGPPLLDPVFGLNTPENPFSGICQMSGGMVMFADPQYQAKQLNKFATMVRERYILEFARARNDTPGEHSIMVTIKHDPAAYVRPAGVTILLPEGERANDPDTIPRDATDAPELGTRKPLKVPH